MIEFYPQIKSVHVAAVILSGGLFALRGAMMLTRSRLIHHPALRHLSYAIDTVLLAAALMLVSILHQYPFAQDWLTAKVALLLSKRRTRNKPHFVTPPAIGKRRRRRVQPPGRSKNRGSIRRICFHPLSDALETVENKGQRGGVRLCERWRSEIITLIIGYSRSIGQDTHI